MWLSITFFIIHGLIWSWRVNPGAVWTYWVPFRVPNEQVWSHKKGNKMKNKLGLSSAKLSRAKFCCLEVIFEVVSKDNLK